MLFLFLIGFYLNHYYFHFSISNQNILLDEKQSIILSTLHLKVNIIWDLTDKDKEKINDIIQKSVGKFIKSYQSNIEEGKEVI